jgi:hypothetical protein
MAGAHKFQAVLHPEFDTLVPVASRDILKKRARYLRLMAKNNRADGVNVTPITVVTLIYPGLHENLIDMENIDADSVDDCDENYCRWGRRPHRLFPALFYFLFTPLSQSARSR